MKKIGLFLFLIVGGFTLLACEISEDSIENGRIISDNGNDDSMLEEDKNDVAEEDADSETDDKDDVVIDDDADSETDDEDDVVIDDDTDNETDDEESLREFTLEELSYYDGRDGRDAYIAVNGYVYDVTNSSQWRDGNHRGRIQAGADLTDVLENEAPHGSEMLARVPKIGILIDEDE